MTALFFLSQLHIHYRVPSLADHSDGKFHFHIQTLSNSKIGWVYKGNVATAPGAICVVHSKKNYKADCDYIIEGTLHKKRPFHYIIKTQCDWKPIPRTHSFAQYRYQIKRQVKAYFKKVIPNGTAAQFLSALAIGEIEQGILSSTFRRLGLSHLLVISGLHFAILAYCLFLFFRLFLSPKNTALLMIVLLTIYCFTLGHSPSVQRAWIAVMIILIARLFDRIAYQINTLGVALGITTICYPIDCIQLSFQLSFLATAGILFYYQIIEKNVFPKHPLNQVLGRPFLWQHGYLVYSFLRQSFVLTCAVHLPLIPFLLFTFHFFLVHGLIYNIFFPMLITPCMVLLIAGSVMHQIIPPFGLWIHHLNGAYTASVIWLADFSIIPLKTIYVESFSGWLLTIILTALFMLAVLIRKKDAINDLRSNFQSMP